MNSIDYSLHALLCSPENLNFSCWGSNTVTGFLNAGAWIQLLGSSNSDLFGIVGKELR